MHYRYILIWLTSLSYIWLNKPYSRSLMMDKLSVNLYGLLVISPDFLFLFFNLIQSILLFGDNRLTSSKA